MSNLFLLLLSSAFSAKHSIIKWLIYHSTNSRCLGTFRCQLKWLQSVHRYSFNWKLARVCLSQRCVETTRFDISSCSDPGMKIKVLRDSNLQSHLKFNGRFLGPFYYPRGCKLPETRSFSWHSQTYKNDVLVSLGYWKG